MTIELWGGLHGVAPIRVRIKATERPLHMGELLDELSEYQRKRLDKHFCGMSDCTCGGVVRAEFDVL